MIINTDSDFIAYFDVINQLKPGSVLDIGMFLKASGCVCRQASSKKIPENILLDGIDLFPAFQIPIYQKIYHHIYSANETPVQRYDLSTLLGLRQNVNDEQSLKLWLKALTYSDYILSDLEDVLFIGKQGVPLSYQPLDIGSKKYAFIQNKLSSV